MTDTATTEGTGPAPTEIADTDLTSVDTKTNDAEHNTSATLPRPRPAWPEQPSRPVRIARAAAAAAAELRIANEQPESLKTGLALAQRGNWTTSEDGPLRVLAAWHFRLIQAPVLVLGSLIAWAARTPGRLWTVLPLLLIITTALDQIPVINLLVPDFLTFFYWPPFCWFT